MNIRYTIYFKGGKQVEGVLGYRPDRDYLYEIEKTAFREMIESGSIPKVLNWRREHAE